MKVLRSYQYILTLFVLVFMHMAFATSSFTQPRETDSPVHETKEEKCVLVVDGEEHRLAICSKGSIDTSGIPPPNYIGVTTQSCFPAPQVITTPGSWLHLYLKSKKSGNCKRIISKAKVLSIEHNLHNAKPTQPQHTITWAMSVEDAHKVTLATTLGSIFVHSPGTEDTSVCTCHPAQRSSPELSNLARAPSPTASVPKKSSGTFKLNNQTYTADADGKIHPIDSPANKL